MSVDIDDFIQCRHYRDRRGYGIDLIILHTTNSGPLKKPTDKGIATARNVATYFSHTPNQASSHITVDPREIIGCTSYDTGAYGTSTRGINRGIHYEICAWAEWSREQWLSVDYGVPMLDRLARLIARDTLRYKIPVRRLTPLQLREGVTGGIVDHYDTNVAWRGGRGHTDIGKGFPWDIFMNLVTSYRNNPERTPVLTVGDYGGKASLRPRGTQGIVRSYQKRLIKAGYDLGSSGPDKDGADDDYGALTGAATSAFRVANGLQPGVTADGDVWRILNTTKPKPPEPPKPEPPVNIDKEKLKKIQRYAKAIWLLVEEIEE